ncbi:MAG: rhomboid family intramembrane serine protease [Bernardetiaceae bacterium]|nr:rhomboid family intramembrane serine protease [Bernardetiaceae bacterium]
MQSLTPVVKGLLLLNVVIFLAQAFTEYNPWILDNFALHYIGAEKFMPHQFVSHMFLHGGWFHLFSNMFALFIFGTALEKTWGPVRFFAFYMVTGLGAAALHAGVTAWQINEMIAAMDNFLNTQKPELFFEFVKEHASFVYNRPQAKVAILELINNYERSPESAALFAEAKEWAHQLVAVKMNIPTVGASGAVFGLLMGFGMMYPNVKLMLLFFPVPIKAKYFVALYGAYELYTGFQAAPDDNIAHFAHLGGLLFAFILIKLWKLNK